MERGPFRDGLISCVESMCDEETSVKILDELEAYQNSEGSFGRNIAVKQQASKNFNPAKWWANHGSSAMHLKELAVKILNLTCSSSGCERNWSTFEQVHTKKRARLLHDRLSDIVFVKFNSKLLQKREDKSRDPVEIKNVDVLLEEVDSWVIPSEEQSEDASNPNEKMDELDSTRHVVSPSLRKKKKRTTDAPSSSRPAKKKKKIIPVEDEDFVSSSSSEEEDADDQIELRDTDSENSSTDSE